MPASTARRAPRGLATSADQSTSAAAVQLAAISSASASAGTALGDTNDGRLDPPHAGGDERAQHPQLGLGGSGASSCSPSRMPTSRTSTWLGRVEVGLIVAPFSSGSVPPP